MTNYRFDTSYQAFFLLLVCDIIINIKLQYEEKMKMIGKMVKVIIDRPLGTYHPKHKDIYYTVNYGYVEGIIAGDGEEQDAYVLGVYEPVKEFFGKVIAIIHRYNDVEEKWVVANEDKIYTKEEIKKQVEFQEKYFNIEIKM
jgi:inorganic pyrophosphatase